VVFPSRDWGGKLVGVTKRLYWPNKWCYRCKTSLIDKEASKKRGKEKLHHRCPKSGLYYSKYMHSSGPWRNTVLYGEWLYGKGAIPVIVEGSTDAMNLWEKGLRPPEASPLGVFGAIPGKEQIGRLLEKIPEGVPVVVLADNDQAGDNMAMYIREFVEQIDPDRDVIIGKVPDEVKDPGDMTQEQVQELRTWIAKQVS